MGILGVPLEYLHDVVRTLPRGFTVCELGDQYVTHDTPRRLAKEFYLEQGCSRYESVDGNGRGTITADLNRPLDPFPGRFDLVTDFGTGEHVWNQHQAWKTVHDLCRSGGYIVFDRPTQGYRDHCYWLANECVWQDLAEANNYEIMRLEHHVTTRGELIRGVFLRRDAKKFHVPMQGRYKKLLRPIRALR